MMQNITDWADLWAELVEIKKDYQKTSIETPGDEDKWCAKAQDYDERVKHRWKNMDSSRETVLSFLESDASILDIGAGTGAWSLLFSECVRKVTAVEPSRAMREIFLENIRRNKVSNIEVIEESWPEANPGKHDYSFCSHAMYGVADFRGFVKHMIDCTDKMCFLLIRAPSLDGMLSEAFMHIYHQPHDSPNFTIAYNILIQMGIYANVQIEKSDKWYSTKSASFDEAFTNLKIRLGLHACSTYDDYLQDILKRKLVKQEGYYYWSGGYQSALIFWSV
ncbi:MAG: class I SAM-dependent methyltransferase [Anaerolineales bacterium]|nr:class I SAM-dependent methyltransferase [Anaerolineales bacterium]